MQAPPLGVMSRWRHQELRWMELGAAISRYAQSPLPMQIPLEWVTEFNELAEIINKRSPGYEPNKEGE
jgi:hypothetical protein